MKDKEKTGSWIVEMGGGGKGKEEEVKWERKKN